MTLSSLTIGQSGDPPITPTFSPTKNTGYSISLPPAVSGGSETFYAITATPTSENVSVSYELRNAPDSLSLSTSDGVELVVASTTHVTGTLCVVVSYENLTNTYEIGISIDPVT